MKKTSRSFAPLFASAAVMASVFSLSACTTPDSIFNQDTWDVAGASALPNQGGVFDQALQKGYIDLATAEYSEGDWSDARYYITQIRAAAAAQRPEPDVVKSRDLPPETIADLIAARAALMSVYERSGRILAAEESARAQIQYECWIQEQEENIPEQAAEVAGCRAGFEQALAEAEALLGSDTIALLQDLDGGVGKVIITPKNATAGSAPVTLDGINQASAVGEGDKAPEKPFVLDQRDISEIWGKALDAQPIPPKRFQLYFLANGTQLTEDSLALLPDIATDAKRRPVLEIEILGHTDTVGNAATNARLSGKRAEAVRDLLISKGFDAAVISTRGFGEGMLLVKTPDNTAEAKNRRVEVIVR